MEHATGTPAMQSEPSMGSLQAMQPDQAAPLTPAVKAAMHALSALQNQEMLSTFGLTLERMVTESAPESLPSVASLLHSMAVFCSSAAARAEGGAHVEQQV